MEKEKDDNGKPLPIERYKHFKGIYLESTLQYFLCDFYEIVHPDSSITYRVKADYKSGVLMIEMYLHTDGWKTDDTSVPKELELQLREVIEGTFCGKTETSTDVPHIQENAVKFKERLRALFFRKKIPNERK